MRAIVVLSHHMDQTGKLGPESLSRADLAIDTFLTKPNIELILTIGWAYREDTDKPIGLSVKEYLLLKGIEDNSIKTDINSRDTVGDAVFSKMNFVDIFNIDSLIVVTSDYHVIRAKQIFETIIPIDIEVLGCETTKNGHIFSSEADSLNAFNQTFENTNFTSNDSLLETLRINHPFYNGKIYKKIKKNPLPLL